MGQPAGARLLVGMVLLSAGLVAATATAGAAPRSPKVSVQTVLMGTGSSLLSDVTCPTPHRCLALGAPAVDAIPDNESAALYRTTDAGQSWTSLIGPPIGDTGIVSLTCGSATFCMLALGVAGGSAFEASHDGGTTWSPVSSFAGEGPVSSLTCVGTGTCVAVASDFVVISTTDGGLTWRAHKRNVVVVGVTCPAVRACYLLERDPRHDRLWVGRSANRGGSVSAAGVFPNFGSDLVNQGVLACSSVSACALALPYGAYFSTTDGGLAWSGPSAIPDGNSDDFTVSCGATNACTVLSFLFGQVYGSTTTDGGATWSWALVPSPGPVSGDVSLACVSATTCLGVGGGRDVYDLGGTPPAWTDDVVAESTGPLTAVGCDPVGTCLALGDGTESSSTDGGQTWALANDPSLSGDQFTSISCPAASTCLASGVAEGTETPFVLVTSNGGGSWDPATLPWEVTSIHSLTCATASVCLAVPGFPSSYPSVPTQVLRSTDGGMTWSLLEIAPSGVDDVPSGVDCPSAAHCVLVGSIPPAQPSGIYDDAFSAVSDDAGATWTLFQGVGGPGGLSGVTCASVADCLSTVYNVAVGLGELTSTVEGTTDGGQTWTSFAPLPGDEGGTVDACSAASCWGVGYDTGGPAPGDGDVIVLDHSADGGHTWTSSALPFGVVELEAVTTAPDGTALAVGGDQQLGAAILSGSP